MRLQSSMDVQKLKGLEGTKLFSAYFHNYITVQKVNSDIDWYFLLNDVLMKARVPLTTLLEINKTICEKLK